MKNPYLLSVLIVLFISGCVDMGAGPGEMNADAAKGRLHSMGREVTPKLAGSWKLVSFHSKDPSGQTAYPFGKDAQGRLIYEPDGRMAVQLMNPHRPRFTSDDPMVTSEAEVRAAFGGYTAYYGTYSVNPDEQTIVHHIEAALLPNWVGTDQPRHFEFDGKYLTLQGPLLLGGVQGVVSLVWERLP
ncbi:MAG: lipocalin-like domain-containing protein [Desulfobaccales bacterium]